MKLGAKAVLIANNGSTGFFRMTQTGYTGTISIPSASMPLNSAGYLWNALAAGSSLSVSFQTYLLPAGELGLDAGKGVNLGMPCRPVMGLHSACCYIKAAILPLMLVR